MTVVGVSLALCALLPALSRALPLNSSMSRSLGLCEYARQHRPNIPGAFVPQCDAHGNFLPQQCSGSTGYCWCVNIITGEEIPNTRTPPGMRPVNCDREFHCPYGWSQFSRSCFIFIDSKKSWAEAEGFCLFEEANLVSIHSYEENHYIRALTRGKTYDFPEVWTGGHDAVHHGFWMWSDGTKFNYGNWYKESDAARTQRCLKMNYGYERKWNYASCNETLPFVCAKRI